MGWSSWFNANGLFNSCELIKVKWWSNHKQPKEAENCPINSVKQFSFQKLVKCPRWLPEGKCEIYMNWMAESCCLWRRIESARMIQLWSLQFREGSAVDGNVDLLVWQTQTPLQKPFNFFHTPATLIRAARWLRGWMLSGGWESGNLSNWSHSAWLPHRWANQSTLILQVCVTWFQAINQGFACASRECVERVPAWRNSSWHGNAAASSTKSKTLPPTLHTEYQSKTRWTRYGSFAHVWLLHVDENIHPDKGLRNVCVVRMNSQSEGNAGWVIGLANRAYFTWALSGGEWIRSRTWNHYRRHQIWIRIERCQRIGVGWWSVDAGLVVSVCVSHSLDSSRFWPAESYRVGVSQPSYDKQYLRDYLCDEGLQGKEGVVLPQSVIDNTLTKYQEAFNRLTGPPMVAT